MKEYSEHSIQYFIDDWWINDNTCDLRRGRLLWAFIPHMDQQPMILVPEGRSSPMDHSKANYKIEPLQIKKLHEYPKLPIAALPSYAGEVRAVYRMKKHPVLVVGSEPPEVPKRQRAGGAAWQFLPYILVAPYYGAEFSGKTGGWNPDFVKRVQECEYPQYMWDKLPEKTNSSILRLDHIQPIGTDQKAYECTPFCLGSDALKILDEWVQWLMTGCLQADGVLYDFRKGLLELA
ncbi:MAG: hypothetical protein FD159_455 [Syntrophaceae bacterium]|nr:MAG: hypothetical protein FD159_455 [Syntrophaceae bacterium]